MLATGNPKDFPRPGLGTDATDGAWRSIDSVRNRADRVACAAVRLRHDASPQGWRTTRLGSALGMARRQPHMRGVAVCTNCGVPFDAAKRGGEARGKVCSATCLEEARGRRRLQHTGIDPRGAVLSK